HDHGPIRLRPAAALRRRLLADLGLSRPLQCHPGSRSTAVRSLRARVRRMPSGALAVNFKLDADFDRLRIPPRRSRRFKDGLWRHTCFEVFVATRSRAYREYNFSPSGEWATYAFRSYRKRIATHLRRPRFHVHRHGLVATIEARGRVKI